MRRIAFAIVPLLFLASCGQEPVAPGRDLAPTFSASTERSEVPIAVDWVAYNQCLDEDLHGSGTSILSSYMVTTNKQVRTVEQVRLGEDWQLVGLSTGQIWLPVPGDHNTVVVSAAAGFLTVQERFTFKNQTTGVVLVWPTKITLVTNANGEVKVDRFQFDDCTLIH